MPAVISPYVIPRIGVAAARELFLTGERFGSGHARDFGLVSRVVGEAGLDRAVAERISELMPAGPGAQAAVKRLLSRFEPAEDMTELTAAAIAEARASVEGREGLAACLERRAPAWLEVERPGGEGAGCDSRAGAGASVPT